VVGDVACALLDEYAPPRPVRLLGVRVAAFEEDTGAGEPTPQMTLALEA
jgi:DNA polymerase-4